MELIWPSHIPVAEMEWRLVDYTGRFSSPLSGYTRTVSRGQRLACTYRLSNLSAADRAYVLGLVAALRGGANRIWLYDPANRQRGTFPGTELLANPTFANGTTGWTGNGQHAITVADRVLKLARAAVTSPNGEVTAAASTVTQYAPYCGRALFVPGRGAFTSLRTVFSGVQGGAAVASGLASVVGVAAGTTLTFGLSDQQASGPMPGDYALVPYTSLARCALVDGGPNLLLQSQQFATTWSKTNMTLPTSNDTQVAPDGTTTAELLQEDTTVTVPHGLSQTVTVPSAVADYAFSVSLKAGSKSWAYIQVTENSGSTAILQYVNLATGALGGSSTGGNWQNLRAFSVSEGNGWFRVTIVGLKATAATSLSVIIGLATGDGFGTYTGTSQNILAWGASLAQSGVPVRYRSTTTTAVVAESQSGTGIWLKGLPASAAGLLLPGDGIEIQGERKIMTASLDSDAAGCAYAQFEPAMRVAAADNAPVIIGQPLMKGLLVEDPSWTTRPGHFSDLALSFVEA